MADSKEHWINLLTDEQIAAMYVREDSGVVRSTSITEAGPLLADFQNGGPAWLDDAACANAGDDVSLYFPQTGSSTNPAIEQCRVCPVREECLRHAYTLKINHGTFGGLSPGVRAERHNVEDALVYMHADQDGLLKEEGVNYSTFFRREGDTLLRTCRTCKRELEVNIENWPSSLAWGTTRARARTCAHCIRSGRGPARKGLPKPE